MMEEINILKRRIERERKARLRAEQILEEKAKELWDKNKELQALNIQLNELINERTNELKVNQLRFSKLISSLQNAILVEDEEGNIVLSNRTFCDLFGLNTKPAKLVGEKDIDIHIIIQKQVKNNERFLSRMQEIVAQKKFVHNETLHLTNGLVLERDYVPIFLGATYLGHLWMYRNVTERWVASEQLRQSEEKYRGIIENMELGLMEVDSEGKILRAYERFCRMVGYTEQELIGQDAAELLLPDSSKVLIQKQTKDRNEGKAGIYEIQLKNKSGELLWALISGAPIYNEHDEVIGSIGIHYDITEQKQMQSDLIAAKARAEEAEELEKQFLANMSHEMRTPLNAIVGMSHLLYDTHPSSEQKEYLDVLKSSSDILLRLISDILDLSKIRAGKVEVHKQAFDVRGLVRSLHRTFEIRLQDTPVEIYCDIDPQIDTFVEGDELLLNQILINIIGNSVKFTKKGRIDIRVQMMERKADQLALQFTISDTGIGIPDEKKELIFQAFRQVDGAIKRKFGGTGLGLAITKKLVELQGGSIRVSSKVGRGSRFTIELDYQDTGRELDVSAQTQKLPTDNTQLDTILIVEDNSMNRKYICSLLEKWNIQYEVAVNGAEGFRMAKMNPYSLIFMDIQMPEMDGYETTIAIRSSKNPNQDTPIIALTASAMLSNKDKAFEAGMVDYLSKPFTPEQLLGKLHGNYGEPAPIGQVEVNYDLIAEMYGGDVDYAADMFQVFLDEMAPKFSELRPLLAEKDLTALGKLAHLLKPSAAMVGATDLHHDLEALEQGVKGDLSHQGASNLVEKIEREFEKVLPIVQQQLTEFGLVAK